MLKPFSAAELIARVSSLIRRTTVYNPAEKEKRTQYKINKLILDESTGVAKIDGQSLGLTDIEYKLLLLLLKNKGKVLSIEFIFHEIWGEAFMQTSKNTVVVHVRNIRRKLSQYDKETEYIHTVWGKGYAIY
jgi:two-component system response regulator VanR